MSEHISTMGTAAEFIEYAHKLRKCIADFDTVKNITETDEHELIMLDTALDLWIGYFETWIAKVEAG